MTAFANNMYDGDADQMMSGLDPADCITVLPDAKDPKVADADRRIRIMWGQYLLDDLLHDHYNSLVCAVNAHDNSHGIITQLAELLPTSQWHEDSITRHAKHFVQPHHVTVVKYDMDTVEVLALLRPSEHDHLTVDDLAEGFSIVSEMIERKPHRKPCATVSFIGAHANKLVNAQGGEPSFESVLRTMYEGGFTGDVYPATYMWESSAPVFARYPFPESIERMRSGGF